MDNNNKDMPLVETPKTENLPNFQYAISNILKNLYDSYIKGELTLIQKSEIKRMIFSKHSALTNIFEDLKIPILFNHHLKLLKSLVENLNDEKEMKSANLKSNKTRIYYFSQNIEDNHDYFFVQHNGIMNLDPNESIYFIDKTNQNLFSDQDTDNLSTTLGLTCLINDSTNPSTPLNGRISKTNKSKKNKKFPKQNINNSNLNNMIYKSYKTLTPTIMVEDLKKKIFKHKNYESDEDKFVN